MSLWKSQSWMEPPHANEIGRCSWTLLHTIAASYTASKTNSDHFRALMRSLSHLYPCSTCRVHMTTYMNRHPLPNGVLTQEQVVNYLVDLHNDVNVRTGKPLFPREYVSMRWSHNSI